jgi:predicted dehydrogenase
VTAPTAAAPRRPSSYGPTVAVIGCGAAAQSYHIPALTRHPEVLRNLVLVEPDLGRAAALAGRYQARIVADLDEVLPDIDAAVIAAPHEWHVPLAARCSEADVDVFCEKPLATNAAAARELAASAAARDLLLGVNQTRRAIPSFQRIRALIADGALGQIRHVSIEWGEIFGWSATTGSHLNGGPGPRGVLLDLGAHAVDLACWWLDGTPVVRHYRDDARGGAPAVCEAQFSVGDTTVDIRLSWLSKLRNRVVIAGDEGVIECALYDYGGLTLTTPGGHRRRIQLHDVPQRYEDIVGRLLDNFLRAIAGLEPLLVPAAEVVESLEVMGECARIREPFDLPWLEAHRRIGLPAW